MRIYEMPQTDSIHELAAFWDDHDLSDFEDQLIEVDAPVLAPRNCITLELYEDEAEGFGKPQTRGVAVSPKGGT